MLRRVERVLCLLVDPPKDACVLDCGHVASVDDGKFYRKGDQFDCPHCGEEWKRGEEEKKD